MNSQSAERRDFARYDAALPIDFEVTGGESRRRMRGTTINISRGGLLADVGVAAPAGSACRVVFHRADGLIEPLEVTGRVLRVGMWTHRRSAVAVGFDDPLAQLELAAAD